MGNRASLMFGVPLHQTCARTTPCAQYTRSPSARAQNARPHNKGLFSDSVYPWTDSRGDAPCDADAARVGGDGTGDFRFAGNHGFYRQIGVYQGPQLVQGDDVVRVGHGDGEAWGRTPYYSNIITRRAT